MKKTINIFLTVASLILFLFVLLAIGAEDSKSEAAKKYGDSALEQLNKDIPKLVEIIRIWKMVDELDLQEDQLVKFLPRYKALNESRFKQYRLRRATSDKMKILLDTSSSDEEIKSELNKAKNANIELRQKEQQLENELYSMLTIKQQAKFVVFQDSFHRDMRRLIGNLKELSEIKSKK